MVESPCNAVCKTDPVSGLCEGCNRTEEEIFNWIKYSDQEKEKILGLIKGRKIF